MLCSDHAGMLRWQSLFPWPGDRGLEFARAQQELTKGFANAVYWDGKVDAYQAMIDAYEGIQL